MKRIYLDYAAATPTRPEVKQVLDDLRNVWANASSLHHEGRQARAIIDNARFKIAKFFNVDTGNIIFTSGATEANVLAVRGVVEFARFEGKQQHIIISQIEHPSITGLCEQLEKEGVSVSKIKTDKRGVVDPNVLAEAINENTVLVSIICGNHELGTVQDLQALAKAAKSKNPKILFHTDAAQAVGWIDIDIAEWGVDMLTASSYKIYGPKGAGFLFIKTGVNLKPVFPGFQEWGMRAGTESTELIAGMAKALELTRDWPKQQVRELRDSLIEKLGVEIKDMLVNTPFSDARLSLPHIAHFSFTDFDSETLNIALDRAGVASSPGSACASGAVQVSHIVEAIGVDVEKYPGSLRLSVGIQTTRAEIDKAVKVIANTVDELKSKS